MTPEQIAKLQDALRTKVSDFNYKNWFQNLVWDFDVAGKVVIKVPSRFVRDWLQGHYLELIKFELFKLTNSEHDISFKLDRRAANPTAELFPTEPKTAEKTQNPVVSVKNFIQHAQSAPAEVQIPRAKTAENQLGFNSNSSFETFVVGGSNQLVHAACRAVAAQPAKSYNPLFIYGGVGLGKTHLLNAIGLDVRKQFPSWRIVYVTGEHFTNEVVSAIRYDKTFELRRKYRESCDVLLIDDIQFIAGKERTMEEFFHTFNALYEARKQIILTSDKPPKDIPALEERLRSRFGWGLLVDIQPPDLETRMAILQNKAERERVVLPADVCEFIAARVVSNVRELEGALIRMVAFSSLTKTPITLDLAKTVLHDLVATPRDRITIESIQHHVSEHFRLKVSDLKSARRHQALAFPRQIAMYLCKQHLSASFPEIGNKFGGKDHSTVIHAVRKIRDQLIDNTSLQRDVAALEKILGVTAA